MELVHWFVDFLLHLDQHLAEVIQQYGAYTYGLLFLIVFLETGLVVTPQHPVGHVTTQPPVLLGVAQKVDHLG